MTTQPNQPEPVIPNQSKIDEKAINELSGVIDEWAKKYQARYNKHIEFNYKEIDIELRLIKPEIERKLVD